MVVFVFEKSPLPIFQKKFIYHSMKYEQEFLWFTKISFGSFTDAFHPTLKVSWAEPRAMPGSGAKIVI